MLPVALDAGVGRTAGGVVRDIGVDDGLLERIGEIEDVVVEPELFRHAPGVVDVGHRAAPAVGRTTPELQRGSHHVVARLARRAAATEESTPPDMATSTRTLRPATARRPSA